ncbi:MAG: hypothetical protein L3J98_04875 [Gammaproteobacteria bacterium]|nr:hypothetical protein [Gammaproteobacteria bacterium]MCF6259484.1 hypothetical protein [Gammaproteobacteria bacterium]
MITLTLKKSLATIAIATSLIALSHTVAAQNELKNNHNRIQPIQQSQQHQSINPAFSAGKTPAESVRELRRAISKPTVSAGYYECYPSSKDFITNCDLFRTLCEGADGGIGKLPGGGYSCSTNGN